MSDPFATAELPAIRESTALDLEAWAVVAQFNRNGSLLAVGCKDGRIYVMDYLTKNVVRSLLGHLLPITSVGWSPSGNFVYSSSADWSLIVWDLLNGVIHRKFPFNCPILYAEIHPQNE